MPSVRRNADAPKESNGDISKRARRPEPENRHWPDNEARGALFHRDDSVFVLKKTDAVKVHVDRKERIPSPVFLKVKNESSHRGMRNRRGEQGGSDDDYG